MVITLLKKLNILGDEREVHPILDAVSVTGLAGLVMFISVGQRPATWIVIGSVLCLSIPLFWCSSQRRKTHRPPDDM